MTEPATPAQGLGVLHLFWKLTPLADREVVTAVAKRARGEGDQVVLVSMLGHKADLGVMALGPDLWRLRRIQTELAAAGLELVDSYVSMTELSEYAKGLPEEMAKARLYPQLPPEGKPSWCFYPMSKKREADQNWFTLPFEDRKELMYEHGASGRTFAGRVLQLVTGSAGVDDYEWGVTLFGQRPDDLKEVVYTMRFDRASAVYAEFGRFYTGLLGDDDEVLDSVGLV